MQSVGKHFGGMCDTLRKLLFLKQDVAAFHTNPVFFFFCYLHNVFEKYANVVCIVYRSYSLDPRYLLFHIVHLNLPCSGLRLGICSAAVSHVFHLKRYAGTSGIMYNVQCKVHDDTTELFIIRLLPKL